MKEGASRPDLHQCGHHRPGRGDFQPAAQNDYKVRADYDSGQYCSQVFDAQNAVIDIAHSYANVQVSEHSAPVYNAPVYLFTSADTYLGSMLWTYAAGLARFKRNVIRWGAWTSSGPRGGETLIRSLSRFSERAMLIIIGRSDVLLEAKKIGPALIFERLWKQTGIRDAIWKQATERKFEFNVERAVFFNGAAPTDGIRLGPVLRPIAIGLCDQRGCGYRAAAPVRVMGFLGEDLADQSHATAFGQRGFSQDYRPDLKQMVLGVVLDDKGLPFCCEMWPGNTADVKSLLPVVESIRKRFAIRRFCIVADRGMISAQTLAQLESADSPLTLHSVGADAQAQGDGRGALPGGLFIPMAEVPRSTRRYR